MKIDLFMKYRGKTVCILKSTIYFLSFAQENICKKNITAIRIIQAYHTH